MKRPTIWRDWSVARAKVEDEGCCRNCKRSDVRLEAAHTLGREYDEEVACAQCNGTGEGRRGVASKCSRCGGLGRLIIVDPLHVIPLCGPATSTGTCHGQHHARILDLLPIMSGEEQLAALEAVVRRAKRTHSGNVGITEAYRRLSGSRAAPDSPVPDGSVPETHPDQITAYDIIEGHHH